MKLLLLKTQIQNLDSKCSKLWPIRGLPDTQNVFPCFHSNRLQKTQNGGIFAFKSKEQCLLPKTSKFDVLLKKLENSPAHGLNKQI